MDQEGLPMNTRRLRLVRPKWTLGTMRIAWPVAVVLVSLIAIPLTASQEQPLAFFANNLWVFLFSYFVQPAYCVELIRYSYWDVFAVIMLLLNTGSWLHAVISPLCAKKEQFTAAMLASIFFGLFVNSGNFILTAIRSV
jgi:hypothetical protein